MKDKQGAYLAGIGATVMFGSSYLFIKNALDYIDTYHLLALRFLLSALFMTVLVGTGAMKVSYRGKDIRPLLLTVIFQPLIFYVVEAIGVNMTSSSQAGMMAALIPIITTVLGAAILKERTSLAQIGFVLLSVTGVCFVVFMQGSFAGGRLAGYLFLLASVFCAAMFNVLSRKSSQVFNSFEITYLMMWVGAIAYNAISLILHVRSHNLSQYLIPLTQKQVLIPVLCLSLCSSIIGFLLFNYALSKLQASQASVLANLATVVAIVAGVVFRNEPFLWFHLVGTVMILVGVWGSSKVEGNRKQFSADD